MCSDCRNGSNRLLGDCHSIQILTGGVSPIEKANGAPMGRVLSILLEAADGSVTEIAGEYLDFKDADGRIYLENNGTIARLQVDRYVKE